MVLGGVLLAAGVELDIANGDYKYGTGRVNFLVKEILEIREEYGERWIVLQGHQRPGRHAGWMPRKIQVKVNALKASMILNAA